MVKIKMFLMIMLLINFTLIANAYGREYPDVSKELAEIAVLHEARQIYGAVSVYDVATYYDLEGEPEVYCFTLYRKTDQPPSISDLIDKISNARKKKFSLQSSLKDINDKFEQKNIKNQIIKIQNDEILNSESFVTAFAGAHEGHVPVIRMNAGLPPHLAFIEEDNKLAEDHSRFSHLRFRRAIYLGMFNIGFEFEDFSRARALSEKINTPGEDDNPIVNHYRKKVISLRMLREKILQAKEIPKSLSSEQLKRQVQRTEKLKKKWNYVKELRDFKRIHGKEDVKRHGLGPTESERKVEPSYTEKILKRYSEPEDN